MRVILFMMLKELRESGTLMIHPYDIEAYHESILDVVNVLSFLSYCAFV